MATPHTTTSPRGARSERGLRPDRTLVGRLMVSMVALLAATIVTLTVVARAGVRSLVPLAVHQQEVVTEGLARALDAHTDSVRADVLLLAGSLPLAPLLEANRAGLARPKAHARVVRAFDAILLAHPEYLQARLIGVADDGREVVRVERAQAGDVPRTLPDRELQHKGHRPYFAAGLGAARGEVAVSDVELNREHGAVQVPHVPVIRAATPVFAEDGERLGIAIINVDLRMALAALRVSSSGPVRTYAIDAAGNFLVHPDPAREFGFDRGAPFRARDAFPELGDLLARAQQATASAVQYGPEPFVVAASPAVLAGGPRVVVITAAPLAEATAIGHLQRAVLPVGLGALALATLAALVLARTITRPLSAMAHAADRLLDDPGVALPVDEPGEVGVLARTLDRMRAQVGAHTAALMHGRDRLRRIVDASPHAVLVLDADNHVLQVNHAAEALFGFPTRELVGRRVEVLDLGTASARRDDREPRQELVVQRVGSRERTLEVTSVPFQDPDGPAMLLSIVDVSERMRARTWFERVVEASPQATVVVSHAGRIQFVNDAAVALFGHPRDAMYDQPVELLVPATLRGTHAALVQRYAASPRAGAMAPARDLVARRHDGTTVPVEIGLTPIEGPDGPAVLATIMDITERKRWEGELRQSHADLEQLARVASRDLEAPLDAIQAAAAALEPAGDADKDRAHAQLLDGARHLRRLVDDLTAFARGGQRSEPLQPVDAGEVWRRAVHALGPRLRETAAEIDVTGDLPAVLADPPQLQRAFELLLTHAAQSGGDAPPRIQVGAARAGDLWELQVHCRGVAVDPEHPDHFLDLFGQRDASDDRGPGLAVARRIVQQHGGALRVTSAGERDATFHVTLLAVPGAA